ncbi:hypothetical protein BH11MYX4_BH11MYX4_48830 [soil metagenome]
MDRRRQADRARAGRGCRGRRADAPRVRVPGPRGPKHGSLIHRELGANFRLACVLTDVPLLVERPDVFGGDDFCASCRVCAEACPPDAIVHDKQIVRGERRWYVDFDKCLPYFNENLGCAICLAVCPFSRPVIGPRLVAKLARKRRDS